MKEIELSTMVPGASLELAAFESSAFLQTQHHQYDWASGWTNILQVGLYQKGPDVSEVGSTWMENLVDMRALRPFAAQELKRLGGREAFVANAWPQEVVDPAQPSLGPRPAYSIPWTLDTRLVYFRRDLFAQAGVPVEGAFDTPEATYETLARLQAGGIQYPLAMATGGLSIHNVASWVWGRGGHFRSPDYRKIALVEPEARRGLVDFFRLHRFIHPEIRLQNYQTSDPWYITGNAAVLFGGQWVMQRIKEGLQGTTDVVRQQTGYAMPPGIPFLGSTHLVVWRHSLHENEALQLIEHLTSPAVMMGIFNATGNLPARLSVLEAPSFSTDPDYRLASECLRRGRGFRSARLWAGVENRLNALFYQLWEDLFKDPALDLEREVERRVRELAVRMERTILAN